MNKNAFYGLIGIAVFELVAVVALLIQVQSKANISSNILRMTSPVKTVYGDVQKVSGNTITVAIHTELLPTLQNKKQKGPVYEVVTDKNTVISRPSSIVLMLFGPAQKNTAAFTVKDIAVGSRISIQTETDLRSLDSTRFHATSIVLPAIVTMVQGTIANHTGDTILVHAVNSPISGKQDYLFRITKDTEISHYEIATANGAPSVQPKKLSAADLVKNATVTVWTQEDIQKATTPTAVRIEPVAAMLAPAITASPVKVTPTATISPTLAP